MTIFIVVTQLLILFTLWYLTAVALKLSNALGIANSEQLAHIIKSGARLEAGAAAVAQDLSDAHARADAVEGDNHGEAADAASQQTEKERVLNNNPKI